MASISFGYLLDVYLTEDDTFKILSKAHPHLLQGNHLVALRVITRALAAVLKKRSRQANKNTEQYELIAGGNQHGMGEILERIRSGHLEPKETNQSEKQKEGQNEEMRK